MTQPGSERELIRYYCTVGNGMEPFLTDELKRKVAAEDVCQMQGKVLFSSSARINKISELKAAERLFLLLKQDSPVQLSAHIHSAKATSVLQSKLLGDRNEWTRALSTWSRLQGELASKTTADTDLQELMMKRGEGRGSTQQKEEEEKCHVQTKNSTGEQKEEERKNRRLQTSEENEAQILQKKRGRDKEGRWIEGTRAFTGAISETDLNGGSVCDQAAPGPDLSVESSSRSMDDFVVERVENVKSAGRGDKTLLQHSRIEPELPSCFPVTFRISCKCTGSLSRLFSTQEVSRMIGVGLSRLLGWKADLKNPQLEINVYLSDDHCLLGIPLTRIPLANRSYIKTTGLRSTIAWAMASLAQIQPGFCVVDPMCGVGTILIEAAQEHKAAFFLGVDIDDGQLQKANKNLEFAELGNRIHLLKASSMVLPLPSASVDAVVCDLPFGKKFGTRANMAANLPVIVTEMERVLCVGGTLVLLLSPQLSCLLKKLLAQKDTGSTSHQESKPQIGIQDCSSPFTSSTKLQTFQILQGVESASTQETDLHSELKHKVPLPLSSLKHRATLRVSLGAIDGLIHKYVKIDA